jgi:arabinose-5-phosphate isomerase
MNSKVKAEPAAPAPESLIAAGRRALEIEERAIAALKPRLDASFARSHPGGTLGRKLLLHVADVMRTGDALPVVAPDEPLAEGLVVMSKKGLGMCVIVEQGRMLGVFTDGDLRRALDMQADIHVTTMRQIMTSPGKSVAATELAAEAAHLMEKYRITALPVIDGAGALVGALNVHDLLRAGVL